MGGQVALARRSPRGRHNRDADTACRSRRRRPLVAVIDDQGRAALPRQPRGQLDERSTALAGEVSIIVPGGAVRSCVREGWRSPISGPATGTKHRSVVGDHPLAPAGAGRDQLVHRQRVEELVGDDQQGLSPGTSRRSLCQLRTR